MPHSRLPLPVLLAAAGLLTSVPGVAQNKRPLTLQDTCYRVSFGAKVELPQWSADGKALQLQGGRWVDARSGDNVTVDQPSAEKRAVTVRGTELLLDGKELTSDGTAKREAHLSPDGARVSFVRGHDLCVLDVADGKVWPVSSDGSEKLLYGYLDWVYQEEVYGRGDFQASWWSPDSRKLAFLRLDEAKVSRFARIDHVPTDGKKPRAALVNQRVEVLSDYYPKAGEPNPTVRLGIAAPAERRVVWVDLAGYDPDVLIVRVAWTPDSRLIFQVQDRIQTWLDLVVADPATGKIEKLFRETSKTWVNILEQPRWLADGKTFLWLSERSGRKHVYRCTPGAEPLPLTAGDWQVRSITKVDEAAGKLWFTATLNGAVNDNLYSIGLDGKSPGAPQRLTAEDGFHEVALNKDGSLFVDAFSTLQQPPVLRVCGADGKVIRELGLVPVRSLRAYEFQPPKLIRVKARDGFALDVTVKLPAGADAGLKPVFVDSYFGPDFPTVSNRWPHLFDPSPTWHEFLRQQGVIVVQVNVRTASGNGQADTGLCYKSFGAMELRDLEDVVEFVCKEFHGDRERVGLTGWSYGGFMTAFAMTHSKVFKLGIAGGGVYDWRLYDTIYTERYMAKPQDNPTGYRDSSCIEHAARLHGHLVLVHGTVDDNVHLQNALQMAHALQLAGKEFDMMLYPKMMHGPTTIQQVVHKRRQEWSWIRRYLIAAK